MIYLAPVVQRVDSTIHWITQLVLLVFIPWIAIYPVDSVIHLLNNQGLGSYLNFCRHCLGLGLSNQEGSHVVSARVSFSFAILNYNFTYR